MRNKRQASETVVIWFFLDISCPVPREQV